MSRRLQINIIINPRKQVALKYLHIINDWIKMNKPQVDFTLCTFDADIDLKLLNNLRPVSEEETLTTGDLIVTLGGDGTILRISEKAALADLPILGVNLGGLGFLANTPPNRILEHLQQFISGEHEYEDRMLLEYQIKGKPEKFLAFNDIVFDKAGFSRVIEIITRVNGEWLNSYIADAMILSTPSGSTGYSLSAGGPIVVSGTEAFILNPICPHSLTNRPVVIHSGSIVEIQVYTEHSEMNIFRDGQKDGSFPSGSEFVIRKSDKVLKLVKFRDQNFYQTLRDKLHWGEDFRDKNRWSYLK